MANLASNLTLLTGAGVAATIAPLIRDPKARGVVQIGAGVTALIASLDIALTASNLIREQNKKFWDAIKDAASLPFGSGSLFEQGLGFLGRATGAEPSAGIETSADRGAVEGPHLGPPKNLLRIAGKIRSIENQEPGQIIQVPLFADTIGADAAIENQSPFPQTGVVRARQLIRSTPYFTSLPQPITLAPGEFRQVSLRLPRDYSYHGQIDFALQWDTHTLDRVAFTML